MLLSTLLPRNSTKNAIFFNLHMFDYCCIMYSKNLSTQIVPVVNAALKLPKKDQVSAYVMQKYYIIFPFREFLMKNFPEYIFQHPCMKILEMEQFHKKLPTFLDSTTFFDAKHLFMAISDKDKWKRMFIIIIVFHVFSFIWFC